MNQRPQIKGQAVIEFAIAFPIFILLCFGLMDIARFYFIEQSVSHSLRAAGRYAVTGQLASNTNYVSSNSNSFPFLSRRESIILAVQSNNPARINIIACATNMATNDNFTCMSATNFSGPWSSNSTGSGTNFIKVSLSTSFSFITPLLNLAISQINGHQPLSISGSLIMKNEAFNTNTVTNATGRTTNPWN